MKILLPVDGSDYTKRMLAYLGAHDELLGQQHEYVAVTVVPQIPAHAARFLDHAAIAGYYRDEAERVLAPVRAYAEQHGWALQALHATGHPADVIAETAAAQRCDLVVMGSHGHTSLGNVILGSVATGVIARCKVPVLLVR